MSQVPTCEHCGESLENVNVKTTTLFTFCKEEADGDTYSEYRNIEKNWDYHGDTYAECTKCNKITYNVTFTSDGRLIPTSSLPQEREVMQRHRNVTIRGWV